MTEFSFPWTCAAIGDGGPYDVEMVEMTTSFLGNLSPTDSGVVFWTDPTNLPGQASPSNLLLEPYNPIGDVVGIVSGVGLVKGWLYILAPSVTFDVSGGNANATDIIGLRLDVAGQTVRAFHGRGGTSATYALVQTSAIWEISLASILLDGSGNLSAWTDVRKFTIPPVAPTETRQFVQATLGNNQTDSAYIYITGSVAPATIDGGVPGIALPTNKSAEAVGISVPSPNIVTVYLAGPVAGIYHSIDFRAILRASDIITVGNVYYSLRLLSPNYVQSAPDPAPVATITLPDSSINLYSEWFNTLNPTAPAHLALNDTGGTYASFAFFRSGTDVLDTYALDINVVGFEVRFNSMVAQPDITSVAYIRA